MKIHQLRNATMVIEACGQYILVDPMLGGKGTLPAFAYFRHKAQKNPLVDLPENVADVLDKVTCCLLTHSQTFGIKALQHTDHLDPAGEGFLRQRNIPVVTREQDVPYLRKLGLNVPTGLRYWKPQEFWGGKITAIPAQHGHGWVHKMMANGAGFYLELPGEQSLYISGDTVFTADVEKTLLDLKPDVAVMAAGSASLDVGGPILMPVDELLKFAQAAPGKVIANHLEALNHCPTTREKLRNALEEKEMLEKVMLPLDGETLTY